MLLSKCVKSVLNVRVQFMASKVFYVCCCLGPVGGDEGNEGRAQERGAQTTAAGGVRSAPATLSRDLDEGSEIAAASPNLHD